MRSTIRTTLAALAAVTALSLSACGDDGGSTDSGDSGGEETAAAESGGEETGAEQPEGEQADVFDIAVGDCIGDFAVDEEISDVSVVSCEKPHDQEVFAIFEVPDGEFPGSEAFQTQVQEDCVPKFETFVGLAFQESALDIKWLEPTEESWSQGDRELVCTVYEEGKPTTGTLEGAKR